MKVSMEEQVNALSQDPSVPFSRSHGMMLRELSKRIYQLLVMGQSSDGNSFHRIITVTEKRHPQYTINRIYQYLRKKHYFAFEQERASDSFLIEKDQKLFFRSKTDLWETLNQIGIYLSFKEIPFHIREKANINILQGLVDLIPKSGLLYQNRNQVSPDFSMKVHTETFTEQHPDGHKIPGYIQCVKIHRISWTGMRYVKIWEIVPTDISNPSPVCLQHGFGGKYHNFHAEGIDSIDFQLAKKGSSIFGIDHDRQDNNTNLDVYVDHYLAIMIDFARERTKSPQVILGGHSMGGLLILMNTVLDSMRCPRFETAIKALVIINSPLIPPENNFMTKFAHRFQSVQVSKKNAFSSLITKRFKGMAPFKHIAKLMFHAPVISHLLTFDIERWLNHSNSLLGVPGKDMSVKLLKIHEIFNPLSSDRKFCQHAVKMALKNPANMTVEHFANMLNDDLWLTSWQYGQESDLSKQSLDLNEYRYLIIKNRFSELNYNDNVYRIPPTIPILQIHSTHDFLSNEKNFDVIWKIWPQRHKFRIDHNPNDELDEQRCIHEITKRLKHHGPSTVIGLLVTQGRHLDVIRTEKNVIASFIKSVEAMSVSQLDRVKLTLEAHDQFRQNENDPEKRFISERDFAKKIRFLDYSQYPKSVQNQLIDMFLNLLSHYEPHAHVGESFHQFMLRDIKKVEQEEIKYNVLHTVEQKLLESNPEPLELMTKLKSLISLSESMPPTECLRSMIDLSIGLFELSRIRQPPDTQKKFNKVLEEFLEELSRHEDMRVGLHAYRGYLHTQDPYFIQKSRTCLSEIPEEWRERAHQILREEMVQQILANKEFSRKEFNENTRPLMEEFQQFCY
ncbi:MAG: hypothetical protein HQM12_12995 [SAR324 cluster bacterium]|nr:hypothetical protein [SAR324 cluster bacterium]